MQGICISGPNIVEQKVWETVKNGTCVTTCLQSVSSCLPATAKAATPPLAAPAPIHSTPPSPPALAAPPAAPLSEGSQPGFESTLTSFALYVGAWSACDDQCSNETSFRPLTCRDVATDLPVDLTTCTYNISDFEVWPPLHPPGRTVNPLSSLHSC